MEAQLVGIMDQLSEIPEPLDVGRPSDWPKKVWIVKFGNAKYGCLMVPYFRKGQASKKVRGLATFTHKKLIERYMHMLQSDAFTSREILQVSYKEAVEIVMGLPDRCKAVFLADDIDKPKMVILKDLNE